MNQNGKTMSGYPLPAVTIGLPVFNGENFLREAIESLLNQSFSDFELIISDNASTDATSAIISEFQKQDSRIRYIRQPANIGASENYLFVLEQAQSNLFMWATHDDVWASNWLEVLTKNFTPRDVGLRGRLVMINEKSVVVDKVLPNFRQGDHIRCFLGNESNYRHHYMYSLFNREKLLAIDFTTFFVDYYADAMFVYCLLNEGALRTIPETHSRFRLHDENAGTKQAKSWKGWKKLSFRVHPLRYYLDYIRYSESRSTKLAIFALIPVKHLYAQASLWLKGARELLSRI